MNTSFVHSTPVPRLYKAAAKTVSSSAEGKSLKQNLYDQRLHPNKNAVYGLVAETIKHESQLDDLFTQIDLLNQEPRFNPWLAKVLFTELIWRKGSLPGESKPIQTVLRYYAKHKDLCDSFRNVSKENVLEKVAKPRYIRVNTLKLSTSDAMRAFQDDGWNFIRCTSGSYDDYLKQLKNLGESDFIPDFHVKVVFAFPSKTLFHNSQAYQDSEIFLQDKATCLAGHLLAPIPGSTILDMCAAPGMKTTHLSALIRNEGTIYSVERDKERFDVLTSFVESAGASCVKLLNRDAVTLTKSDCPDVDYILLDPSCSGSGIDRFGKNNTNFDFESGRLKKLSSFQAKLLRHALNEFSTAKRVVYSTCSLYPQENEEVIQDVLQNHRGKFKLVSAKEKLNNNWNNVGDFKYIDIGEKCIYARPDSDLTSGFFVAVLEQHEENVIDLPVKKKKKSKDNLNQIVENLNEDTFVEKCVNVNVDSTYNEDVDIIGTEKKKKSKCPENIDTTNEKDEIVEKSIKIKKSRKPYTDCENSDGHIVQDDSIRLPVKKKKRKREEILIPNNNVVSLGNENYTKTKKKKKSEDKVGACIDLLCNKKNENTSFEQVSKKKKDKSKHKLNTSEVNENVHIDNEFEKKCVKIKTKSKKYTGTDILDYNKCDIQDDFESLSELKKKKK